MLISVTPQNSIQVYNPSLCSIVGGLAPTSYCCCCSKRPDDGLTAGEVREQDGGYYFQPMDNVLHINCHHALCCAGGTWAAVQTANAALPRDAARHGCGSAVSPSPISSRGRYRAHSLPTITGWSRCGCALDPTPWPANKGLTLIALHLL